MLEVRWNIHRKKFHKNTKWFCKSKKCSRWFFETERINRDCENSIKIFCLRFLEQWNQWIYNSVDIFKKINEWGFNTNPLSKITIGINDIEKIHQKIDTVRSSLDYDIDGLVYKINDLNLQKRLGNTQFTEVGYRL